MSSALAPLGFAGTTSPIPLCTRQVYSASLPGHVFVNVVCRSAADLYISSFTLTGPCSTLFILRGDSPAGASARRATDGIMLHDLDKSGRLL